MPTTHFKKTVDTLCQSCAHVRGAHATFPLCGASKRAKGNAPIPKGPLRRLYNRAFREIPGISAKTLPFCYEVANNDGTCTLRIERTPFSLLISKIKNLCPGG